MKKLIILLIIVCGFTPALRAVGSPNQHLSPKEFRAKQQAFITEKAGLTQEEAAKFFPVYFELQDRKKQLNDEANCFVAVKMKRLPTLNTEKSWKEFMMPASLRTGWIRLILRSLRKSFRARKFIWCKEPRCVSTANC